MKYFLIAIINSYNINKSKYKKTNWRSIIMRNINKILTGFALAATMLVSGQALYATNINQEILELKQRYEDAYKRYTTALKEGASATFQDIKKQYEQAKAKYEEAKKRLTPSEKTKKNFKDGGAKISVPLFKSSFARFIISFRISSATTTVL